MAARKPRWHRHPRCFIPNPHCPRSVPSRPNKKAIKACSRRVIRGRFTAEIGRLIILFGVKNKTKTRLWWDLLMDLSPLSPLLATVSCVQQQRFSLRAIRNVISRDGITDWIKRVTMNLSGICPIGRWIILRKLCCASLVLCFKKDWRKIDESNPSTGNYDTILKRKKREGIVMMRRITIREKNRFVRSIFETFESRY